MGVRMWRAIKTYRSLLTKRQEAVVIVQKYARGFLATEKLKCLRKEKAATTIQKFWRGYKDRKEFLLMKHSSICIQSYARMWQARMAYKLRLEQREQAAIIVQKWI